MNDADRIARAIQWRTLMMGPKERYRCDRHPTRWVIFRWTWDVPGEGATHEDAITSGEPECIRACAVCDAEIEDES